MTNFRKNKYGDRSLDSIIERLEKKQVSLKEKGVDIVLNKDPLVVVIITPIMKRAHQQQFASEICFIDSSASCDQTSTSITFILSATKVGGIPLACILHTSQEEDNYTLAFNLLRKAIPNGFGGNGAPKIFMTDDSKSERNALNTVYPNSTLYLCCFHICQATWRWLWDQKNKIPLSDRKKLMLAFRAILYGSSDEECEELYNDLVTNNTYDNFTKYVTKLWERKKEWCLSYRKESPTRGHNTNNLVEASIRVIKDIILQRCKAFNVVALTDFVTEILENYHVRRLLSYANNRQSKNNIMYNSVLKRTVGLDVIKVDEFTYHVSSSKDKNMFYTVSAKYAFCDCHQGSGGVYCKHLCAVQNTEQLHIFTCPKITPFDKQNFAYIATGNILNTFFEDMSLESENVNNIKEIGISEGLCEVSSRGSILMDCTNVPCNETETGK